MDQDSASQTPVVPAPTVADAPVDNIAGPIVTPEEKAVSEGNAVNNNITAEVAEKISAAQNVLVALSSNPSVDEMAAAIGLSLFLDKIGKRATAIYSGATPNALEFLKPEDTFESSADVLQDFVIALNKEKADHLRYKLDGDYVKIYITPYKTKIGEGDLEFSYGDYNVDLVIALDVANGVDLDAALREHGRIMHDAAIINITTGDPGKFGEIEWSDKNASSVSEMIARLLYSASASAQIDEEEATAFLTGIVAATNRFSNAKTTSDTMQVASKLMNSGANQQLVSKNITPDVDNELYSLSGKVNTIERDGDPTKLNIKHEEGEKLSNVGVNHSGVQESGVAGENSGLAAGAVSGELGAALMEDLKAAEASLVQTAKETIPENNGRPMPIDSNSMDVNALQAEMNLNPDMRNIGGAVIDDQNPETVNTISQGYRASETTVQPRNDSISGHTEPILPPVMNTMGQPVDGETVSNRNVNSENVTYNIPGFEGNVSGGGELAGEEGLSNAVAGGGNPAAMMAPAVENIAEANNASAPQMDYMPLPGQEVLPPPPTPPIDMNIPTETVPATPDMGGGVNAATAENFAGQETMAPVMPEVKAEPYLGQQPAMQDQVYTPQAVDPAAFKIPGTQ